jgi:hypothetical protein
MLIVINTEHGFTLGFTKLSKYKKFAIKNRNNFDMRKNIVYQLTDINPYTSTDNILDCSAMHELLYSDNDVCLDCGNIEFIPTFGGALICNTCGQLKRT